ncbi:MAG: UDP-N-acetylmuramoyl-L-alanine--D-glutamate ligase [Deltaproteobacteria bacterium]|nr:UDP-N-acetylmuramoyl-L-alanine--D-glutamate ligase [Deltaproteobacteria bacterium]
MKVAGVRFLVIGASKTGASTARFLHSREGRVRLVDRCADTISHAKLPEKIETVVGDQDTDLLNRIETVVPSPGVPREHPLLRRAVALHIPVLSEIELASRFLSCPMLAVTGTNGKSTTTTLLGSMLQTDGVQTFVGGNLGTPLIDAVDGGFAAAVVEVSSFQLEWVDGFRPRVAVLLNLTPDHLDRYANVEEYGAAKTRIFAAQQPEDTAVLNRDDPWVWAQRRAIRANAISFGLDRVEFGTYTENDSLICWGPKPLPLKLSLAGVRLQGAHNRENIMAAATAAAVWGVSEAAIQRALNDATGLPHRLELVREHQGVRFYDDSKGTNVGAVEKSVASFDRGVILLAGGYDKGGDFHTLERLLAGRVKHLVLFGASAAKIESQLGSGIPHTRVRDLAAAVGAAAALAISGDTVLLSPGCASFDEFTDYTARGRKFRQLVEAL